MYCKVTNPKLREFVLNLAVERGVCPNRKEFKDCHVYFYFERTLEGSPYASTRLPLVTVEELIDAIIKTDQQITLSGGEKVKIEEDGIVINGIRICKSVIEKILTRYKDRISIDDNFVEIKRNMIICGCVTLIDEDIFKIRDAMEL